MHDPVLWDSYRAILIDVPWPVKSTGKFDRRGRTAKTLPYDTLTYAQIAALPIGKLAKHGAHCWMWATNGTIPYAFDILKGWGFTYLDLITWVKPSGFGPFFARTTQHVLFGYKGNCWFDGERFLPTHITANPGKHSQKPTEFYDLVERVSTGPYLEVFARERRRDWDALGNGIDGRDIREVLGIEDGRSVSL